MIKRHQKIILVFLVISIFILLGTSSCEFRKPMVEKPAGFAILNELNQYAAMSPEGLIYRIRTVKNTPVQDLRFWAEALDTQLEKEGYINLSKNNTFSSNGVPGVYSEWTVPFQGETHKYLVALLTSESTIAVAEMGGEHRVYSFYKDDVVDSLRTINFSDADVLESEDIRVNIPPSQSYQGATQSSRPVTSSNAPVYSSGCLLAGTEVAAAGRAVPIEVVWPGTIVNAFNPETETWANRMVTRAVELPYSGDIITIKTGDNLIEITGNHPVFVKSGRRLESRPLPEELTAIESLNSPEGRWVEARHVKAGDRLISSANTAVEVESATARMGKTQVYHISVSDLHTFGVGPRGIAVHNGGEQESVKDEIADVREREQRIIGTGSVNASLPTDGRDERIRVYSGACTMIIDSIEETKREIAHRAEAVGGYVEHSSNSGIIIRVPAQTFRDSFDEIMLLGEVVHKAIETYDVTSSYTYSAGRLAVAIRARDRLYAVLKKVEDPKERLEILQKIREYSDIIEKLELSKQVLDQRIALSRITIDLLSRINEAEIETRQIPYRWIEALRPLYASTKAFEEPVNFSLPDDIAVFENTGIIRAEAADGTRIRIGTVLNNPQGDSLFWSRALIYHLGAKYNKAENIERNSINLVLFESKERKNPFLYLVGTQPYKRGEQLIVYEVFFPDQKALDRHLEDILEKLSNQEVSQ